VDRKRLAAGAGLAAALAGAVAAFAIPTAWLEGAPTLCLWRHLLGVECPGCGMTRALSAALHGDFAAAWSYNPAVVVVLPLSIGLWADYVRRRVAALGAAPAARRASEGLDSAYYTRHGGSSATEAISSSAAASCSGSPATPIQDAPSAP
jgi:hypothetical protein